MTRNLRLALRKRRACHDLYLNLRKRYACLEICMRPCESAVAATNCSPALAQSSTKSRPDLAKVLPSCKLMLRTAFAFVPMGRAPNALPLRPGAAIRRTFPRHAREAFVFFFFFFFFCFCFFFFSCHLFKKCPYQGSFFKLSCLNLYTC